MIDQKRLEELDSETCPLGVGMGNRKDAEEMYELIDLAHLGLWAKNIGISAIMECLHPSEQDNGFDLPNHEQIMVLSKALDFLPKDFK